MKRFAIILIMFLSSIIHADWLGTWDIDEYLPIHITTNQFSTGALLTTANAQYSIFEETNGTFSITEVVGPTALTMDFSGETGLHLGSVQLSAANTFEAGKSYVVWIEATVDSVVAGTSHGFRIRATPLATATALSTVAGYTDDIGVAGAGLTNIDFPDQTMNITGSLSGGVGSVQGDIAGDVGGNVIGSVASVSADVTTDSASRTASKATGFATPTNITAGTITTATNVTTVNGLAANVITAASIPDATWQELIELMFTYDATAVYGTQAGSVVDQIADSASGSGTTPAAVWGYATRGLTDESGFSLAADQSGVTIGTVNTLTGHTVQTGDSYAIVNSGTYGLSALYDILVNATYGLSALRTRGDAAWTTGTGDGTAANQTTILSRLAAIMSKAAADPSIGTYNPATDSLEAQQENPQGPPIID